MTVSSAILASNPYTGAHSTISDLSDGFGPVLPLDPGTRRRAARVVAGHAHDADDARALLAMLGIDGEV